VELLKEWNGSIILPICKEGGKIDSINCRGIYHLPNTYAILSKILLSSLTPFAEEIIGDHQGGFRSNRSTPDFIICILHIREKMGTKRSSSSAVYSLQESLLFS
jgi:hypothetical protein